MSGWDISILKSRILDSDNKIHYHGSSPDNYELGIYKKYILNTVRYPDCSNSALVLGMTYRLRLILHEMGFNVTCVEKDEKILDFMMSWIPEQYQNNENIINGNWFDLAKLLSRPVDVILGDMIFPNIVSVNDYKRLLDIFKSVLNKNGAVILRCLIIPDNICQEDFEENALIQKFRLGEIGEAEFGFSMRFFRVGRKAYNKQTYLLDSSAVFDYFSELYKLNSISSNEYSILQRYYYNATNLILPQSVWESILECKGFKFESTILDGKLWYKYCPIYMLKAK